MMMRKEMPMSLQSSRAKIQRLTKDLMVQWNQTKTLWNDPVSRRFETEYLLPLDRAVTASAEAMDSMHEIVSRAKRDCD